MSIFLEALQDLAALLVVGGAGVAALIGIQVLIDRAAARQQQRARACWCGTDAFVVLHGEPLCPAHAVEEVRAS